MVCCGESPRHTLPLIKVLEYQLPIVEFGTLPGELYTSTGMSTGTHAGTHVYIYRYLYRYPHIYNYIIYLTP